MLPNVTITGNAGYTALDFASLLSSANLFWTVAGNATQTVFDGFTLLHKKRAAEAAYDQAAWNYRMTVIAALQNVADALRLREMLEAIDSCPAPVVARVQGHALGGGCGLVACCDVVVAERNAQIAFSEVKLGIVPAVISPFALAKIGSSAARRYFVTGERFDAGVALQIGLVHEVVDDLDAAVEAMLAELLTAGPQAARAAKELARRPHTARETAEQIAAHRTSEEGQEGLRAFLEKRAPVWHGGL
jgi:methylglutaconyl-CoA hydratase